MDSRNSGMRIIINPVIGASSNKQLIVLKGRDKMKTKLTAKVVC